MHSMLSYTVMLLDVRDPERLVWEGSAAKRKCSRHPSDRERRKLHCIESCFTDVMSCSVAYLRNFITSKSCFIVLLN